MNMSDAWKKYLNSIYFNPKLPASYSGPEKLYQYVKTDGKFQIGRRRIRQWVQDQEAYSLTRAARRHFRRNRVVVAGIDSQWQADLMDMTSLAKENDGCQFILLMIDVFSRFTWCEPLQNKTGTNVVKAMKEIFEQGRQPNLLQTDKGTEFVNRKVQSYLKDIGVHFFVTQSELKSSLAERCIKTVKHKLLRYIIQKQSYRYIDVLHRSLGVAPDQVNKNNESEIRLQQYLLRRKSPKRSIIKKETKKKRKKPFRFKIGQTVRISHVRKVFEREYSQKWTGELFKVNSRKWRDGLPVYTLLDWYDDKIVGTFYEPELQAVNVDPNQAFNIEKILKRRTRGRRKEVLVRWLHWPPRFDSWIPERDVHDYQ